MRVNDYARRVLLASAIFVLISCGGGGGGGGGSGGSSGGGGVGGTSGITYTGATNVATLSGTNASTLTNNIVGTGAQAVVGGLAGISATPQSGPPSSSGISALVRTLDGGLRAAQIPVVSAAAPLAGVAQAVDTTRACESGSVHITGSIDSATGTGSVTLTFIDCRSGTDTLSGTASAQVAAYDDARGVITDMSVTFQLMSLRGSGVSLDFSGTFREQTSIATNTETLTTNFVIRDNITSNLVSENLVFVDVSNNVLSPSFLSESVSGRIYDKTQGYVDIDTPVPFHFASVSQNLPDAGQMVITGASGARIRMTILSTSLLTLALDLNGDGIYEATAVLHWTDLSGPVGSDLRDDDGDGMHNSWETAYGLNPDDPSDATLDKDGDGADNKVEYLAGTDPTSATSVPASVALALSVGESADPVAVGTSLSYTINITNSSANPANDVVVADTLPNGVSLVSAIASQGGTCSGTSTISCSIGTLTPFSTASITLTVTPTAASVLSNTATVTTSSYEPMLADNTATVITTAGSPTSGLQAQIDAAAPGDTISVPPGLYVGGLDFQGKDITLESTDGPAATILNTAGPVVNMGPGGTLKGFTITGGSIVLGSGVIVSGAGSLITGNIFDGNVQRTGGSGAAIWGRGASATIERNIFRNNICDTQGGAGVVAITSEASPRIVNNVFQNNPCFAITIASAQLTGFISRPEVVNNTFVGNRVGLRVERFVSATTHIYRNNIFVGNGVALELDFGTAADDPVWTNNLLFANTTDYQGMTNQTGINGNLLASPLFVDMAAGNYRLQSGSPAIDAGSALQAPATDFDGVARPRGAGIDIGAFESQ